MQMASALFPSHIKNDGSNGAHYHDFAERLNKMEKLYRDLNPNSERSEPYDILKSGTVMKSFLQAAGEMHKAFVSEQKFSDERLVWARQNTKFVQEALDILKKTIKAKKGENDEPLGVELPEDFKTLVGEKMSQHEKEQTQLATKIDKQGSELSVKQKELSNKTEEVARKTVAVYKKVSDFYRMHEKEMQQRSQEIDEQIIAVTKKIIDADDLLEDDVDRHRDWTEELIAQKNDLLKHMRETKIESEFAMQMEKEVEVAKGKAQQRGGSSELANLLLNQHIWKTWGKCCNN